MTKGCIIITDESGKVVFYNFRAENVMTDNPTLSSNLAEGRLSYIRDIPNVVLQGVTITGGGFEDPTVEEEEIERLRSMLPQKVEGLPTEPGWYWAQIDETSGWTWEVVEVLMNKKTGLLDVNLSGSGRDFAVTSRDFRRWYGPLTPPDQLRDATKMMEVE